MDTSNKKKQEFLSYLDSKTSSITKSVLSIARATRGNEAKFREKFEPMLEQILEKTGLNVIERRERILITGKRADTAFDRVVIEYEPPGSLTDDNSRATNKHALFDQIKPYIKDLDKEERRKKTRYLGIVFDGFYIIYARYVGELFRFEEPIEVNQNSLKQLFTFIFSSLSGSALIPENLEHDFGPDSDIARKAISNFYKSLTNSKSKKTRILFEQWVEYFSEITGFSEESSKLNAQELAQFYSLIGRNYKLQELYFCVHTYYATFIKMLALQIVGFYMFRGRLPLLELSDKNREDLKEELEYIEEGGIFKDVGIINFLEGDFFSWYLEDWTEESEQTIRSIVNGILSYDPVTLEVNPDLTRDILKILYEKLVPRKLRHALGEYYTPDWLAERVFQQVAFMGKPNVRILDPACGSGTFLAIAIRLMRSYARKRKIAPHELLKTILSNLAGIDLNPLAVLSARANFLLAIADLLEENPPEEKITIPIFLADSVVLPSKGKDLFSGNTYRVKTIVETFGIPKEIIEENKLEKLTELLEDNVPRNLKSDEFMKVYKKQIGLPKEKVEFGLEAIELFYKKLVDLQQEKRDKIWPRLVKNSFAPLFLGRFDLVVGNPPWVNWESLPEEYRNESKELWKNYGLFTLSGHTARLGGGKKDISILMTYVAIDKYLKKNGRLAFLITQSVFKTVGAGEGFRRFQLGDGDYFKILAVDDMVKLKPFPGASNSTAVFACIKGEKTRYPIQYNLWKMKRPGGVPTDILLSEIGNYATYKQFIAEPINKKNKNSPWITGRPRSLNAIRSVMGESDYKAAVGVCTWLNGVFWVKVLAKKPNGNLIIENLGNIGKKKIRLTRAEIEPFFVYPLLRGQNVKRWKANSRYHIIVPVDPNLPRHRNAYPEDLMCQNYPLTYKYFEKFKEQLQKRSGYKKYLGSKPFYAVYNIGPYAFAPYKVMWRQMIKKVNACVVGPESNKKPLFTQHVVSFVPFDNLEEAHYFCALMNVDIVSAINTLVFTGKTFGMPKLLSYTSIPEFNSRKKTHEKLAALSRTAHRKFNIDKKN